jgi:hypothetical protein
MKYPQNTKYLFFLCMLLVGCRKESVQTTADVNATSKDLVTVTPLAALTLPNLTGYTKYIIVSGQHECTPRPFATVSLSELRFLAVFDNSAVYKTVLASNQADINKLYGFSDNNSFHQTYSARIGWRWYNNRLELLAYDYNKGVVSSAFIAAVPLGTVVSCSIKVLSGSYVFTVNGVTKTVVRSSTTATGRGYQLYPYFGGDENAPHTINIWIKKY